MLKKLPGSDLIGSMELAINSPTPGLLLHEHDRQDMTRERGDVGVDGVGAGVGIGVNSGYALCKQLLVVAQDNQHLCMYTCTKIAPS